MEDAKAYYVAYKKYKKAYFSECDPQICVVYKPWIKQWRKYVKSKLVKAGYATIKYNIEELAKDYPGPVTNEKVLKSPEKYLRDDDPNDITNFVIKSKASSYMDYKLVPKVCWDILQKRFGGGPELIRNKDGGQYSYSYEVKFNKVSLIFPLFLVNRSQLWYSHLFTNFTQRSLPRKRKIRYFWLMQWL